MYAFIEISIAELSKVLFYNVLFNVFHIKLNISWSKIVCELNLKRKQNETFSY